MRRALARAEAADHRVAGAGRHRDRPLGRHSGCGAGEGGADGLEQGGSGISRAPRDGLTISAKTGEGLPELVEALTGLVEERLAGAGEAPVLTRARHRQALEEAAAALARALEAPPGAPELMAEDMRLALRALGRITGRVDVEDLLDVVFRDFCIGK